MNSSRTIIILDFDDILPKIWFDLIIYGEQFHLKVIVVVGSPENFVWSSIGNRIEFRFQKDFGLIVYYVQRSIGSTSNKEDRSENKDVELNSHIF